MLWAIPWPTAATATRKLSVLFKLGRSEAALKYLERSYAAMQDSEVAAHMGEVMWKLGRKQEALGVWNRALARDPGNEALQDVLKRFRLP